MGEANGRRNGLTVIQGGKARPKDDDLVVVRGGQATTYKPDHPREALGQVLEIRDDLDESYVLVQFQTTEGLKSTRIRRQAWKEMSKTPDLPLGYIVPMLGMNVLMTSFSTGTFKRFKLTLAA